MIWDLGSGAASESFGALLQARNMQEEGETPACETNSSDMQLGGDLCKMPICKAVAQGKTTLHLHA